MKLEKRNHITFKTVSGESKSVTLEMVDRWWEMSLSTLLSNYELRDNTTLASLEMSSKLIRVSMNALQIKPINLSLKSDLVVK